mgnify:CR=1 FL=1
MKTTNIRIFRSIFFASLVLATYISQAQMYPFKSAERIVSLQVWDSTKLLIKTIDENNLIGLYTIPPNDIPCFMLTTQGQTSAKFAWLNGIKQIKDFKVLNNHLFFCGQANNGLGFIACCEVDTLFNPSISSMEIQIFPSVSEINKIDVYEKVPREYHIVAIGDNKCFIHTSSNSCEYCMYVSPCYLSDIVTTDNYIVVLGKISPSNLALFTHLKAAIHNYFGMSYTHNQARFERFLIEKLFGDDVLVSYTDRPNDYQAQFVRINARTCQPIIQQSLVKVGKPNPKEMVFNPADSTVLYLSHAVENKDMVATIKPYLNYPCTSDVVIPNMCKWGHETFNSLTNYRNNYMAVIGVDTTHSNLYWFDYERGAGQGNCFQTLQTKVDISNTFAPLSPQNYLSVQISNKQFQTIQVLHFTPQYNIICND